MVFDFFSLQKNLFCKGAYKVVVSATTAGEQQRTFMNNFCKVQNAYTCSLRLPTEFFMALRAFHMVKRCFIHTFNFHDLYHPFVGSFQDTKNYTEQTFALQAKYL